MTVQLRDTVQWQDASWTLIELSPDALLFHPPSHDLKPHAVSTGCHRGYHCTYQVSDQLRLHRLWLGVDYADRLRLKYDRYHKTLFGIRPTADPHHNAIFENLCHPIDYTGEFFIGQRLLSDEMTPIFRRMGLGHSPTGRLQHMLSLPSCFARVYRLCFHKGQLQHTENLSTQMKESRAQAAQSLDDTDP